MTATNRDHQLGEIYPTMLNELNCTFGDSFQGRSNGGGVYGYIYPPPQKKISPVQVNFILGKNNVRTATEHEY